MIKLTSLFYKSLYTSNIGNVLVVYQSLIFFTPTSSMMEMNISPLETPIIYLVAMDRVYFLNFYLSMHSMGKEKF